MSKKDSANELKVKTAPDRKDDWKNTVYAESIKRQPERKTRFQTVSGLDIDALYTPADLENWDYDDRLGYPGMFPFTRGVYGSMYRSRLWTMRQYAGFGTAEETNKRFKYLLEQGQTGLSVAFDLPTQMGYDPDHPLAGGEVGRVGVSIATLEDMERLLDGIPLDRVSTSMTINATAIILFAMYLAVAEKNNISFEKLSGTLQNDILKEYIARGTYIYPPEPSVRLVIDVIEFASRYVPRWNPISISGYHIREAGANAVQEIAFTFADAITYVEEIQKRGLDLNRIGRRLSFFFAAHNEFFEEVAKFRAARRLWARIMKERFNVTNPEALRLRFHTQTAGSTLTYQQPEVNIIRVAYQALAAVLGGTQSLHTNAYDEALGLPSEKSALLALRTQQVLAEETGVADTIDPLGGSYFIESLTDRLEEAVNHYLQRIEEIGGMKKAIESHYIQKEIQKSAYQYQQEVETGKRVIVGVNRYRMDEPPVEPFQPPAKSEEEQKERVRQFRRSRNQRSVSGALRNLEQAAKRNDVNLVLPVLDAVRKGATLGEIADVFRQVFGEYEDTMIL